MSPEIWIVVAISVALWCGGRLIRGILLRRCPREQQKMENKIARHIGEVLGRCPACNASLSGHRFCEPICIPDLSKSGASRIADSIRNRQWDSIRKMHLFDPAADAVVFWFVECPQTQRGIVYQVESKAGFDENDTVELIDVFDPSASAEFAKSVFSQAAVRIL